jgi:hypothetical protein
MRLLKHGLAVTYKAWQTIAMDKMVADSITMRRTGFNMLLPLAKLPLTGQRDCFDGCLAYSDVLDKVKA